MFNKHPKLFSFITIFAMAIIAGMQSLISPISFVLATDTPISAPVSIPVSTPISTPVTVTPTPTTVPTFITVDYPNGDENWIIGETRRIRWNSSGVNEVRLKYSDGSGSAFHIITLPNNPGYYDWTIPSTLTPGSNYKIEVVDSSLNGLALDWSDNYFSITAPTPTPTPVVIVKTQTLRPNGQGYNQWTNVGCLSWKEWDCVDEAYANATDRVQADNPGKRESFKFSDLTESNIVINKVTLNIYGTRFSSSRYKFTPIIVTNSGIFDGSSKSFGSTYSYIQQTYTNNPATNKPWTAAEVNNLEAGIRTKIALWQGAKIAQMYATVEYTARL